MEQAPLEQAQEVEHKRVVALAVDDSQHAENALNFYLSNVKKDGDFLVLIHCPESLDVSDASPAVADRLIKDKKDEVEKLEKKYLALLREKDADVKGKVRTHGGKPGEVVCRIAQEEGAAVIVCGTRGMGTIRRTIMGSVSDYIVHHSHVPVLVCRIKH